MGPIFLVLVFDCPQETAVQRLLQRGRSDDDTETIKRRIATFQTTTLAVVDKYDSMEKVVRIQADFSRATIFRMIVAALTNANINLQSKLLPEVHLEIPGENSIESCESHEVSELNAGIHPAQG